MTFNFKEQRKHKCFTPKWYEWNLKACRTLLRFYESRQKDKGGRHCPFCLVNSVCQICPWYVITGEGCCKWSEWFTDEAKDHTGYDRPSPLRRRQRAIMLREWIRLLEHPKELERKWGYAHPKGDPDVRS